MGLTDDACECRVSQNHPTNTRQGPAGNPTNPSCPALFSFLLTNEIGNWYSGGMISSSVAQQTEYWPIERLREYAHNPRKNDSAVDRMCASIREFDRQCQRALERPVVCFAGAGQIVGDAVIVEGRFVGTFTGLLATPDGDLQPTGAQVDVRFADVSRGRDGKLISYHTYYDQLGLMPQLGLMDG